MELKWRISACTLLKISPQIKHSECWWSGVLVDTTARGVASLLTVFCACVEHTATNLTQPRPVEYGNPHELMHLHGIDGTPAKMNETTKDLSRWDDGAMVKFLVRLIPSKQLWIVV